MWNFTEKLRFKDSPMGCSFREMYNLYKMEKNKDAWGGARNKVHKTPLEIVLAAQTDYCGSGTYVYTFTDTHFNADALLAFIKKHRLGTVKSIEIPTYKKGVFLYMWKLCPNFYDAVTAAVDKEDNKNVNKTSKRNSK